MKTLLVDAQIANYKSKTQLGANFQIWLEAGKWWIKTTPSVWPPRELSLLEMWGMVRNQNDYHLTNTGLLMKNDERWRSIMAKAQFDEIDRWDETGAIAAEVDETVGKLIEEIEGAHR
jgi:hypothetical protein